MPPDEQGFQQPQKRAASLVKSDMGVRRSFSISPARAKPPETEQQINEVLENCQTTKTNTFQGRISNTRETRPHVLVNRDKAISCFENAIRRIADWRPEAKKSRKLFRPK